MEGLMKFFTTLSGAFVGVLAFSMGAAHPAEAALSCYDIASQDTPQRYIPKELSHHRYCYSDETYEGRNFTFVFNADKAAVRPELSALVERDGTNKIIEITHGSLLNGKVSIHRTSIAAVNPLPVPLSAAEAARVGTESFPPADSLWLDAKTVSESFFSRKTHRTHYTITEGVFEQNLDATAMPFDAYWWPFQGVPLAAGPFSPLGKYDAIVKRVTGTDPQSSAWELQNHSLTDVAWGGHCNGWAASSLLYPEPAAALWDTSEQKVLFSSDLKGMLNEASFCVNLAFYGHRYYGNPGDDLNDIYPDLFHQVLIYYIQNLKKAVAFDYVRDVSVDNSVITGYKFTIKKRFLDPTKFDVVAELRVHHYELNRNENVGAAVNYTRTYSYVLETDGNGTVTGGNWTGGDNPDFLWVPLAQSNCAGENPKIDPDQITKVIASYPVAQTKSVDVNFTINRALNPSESVNIPIPATKGAKYKIYVPENGYPAGLMIVANGSPLYPTTDRMGSYDTGVSLISGAQTFAIDVNELNSLKLINSNSVPLTGKLTVSKMEYLGGN
jgi:hypothetical protein